MKPNTNKIQEKIVIPSSNFEEEKSISTSTSATPSKMNRSYSTLVEPSSASSDYSHNKVLMNGSMKTLENKEVIESAKLIAEEIKEDPTVPTQRIVDHNILLSIDELANTTKTTGHILFVIHGIGAKTHILERNLNKMRMTINLIRKLKQGAFQAPIHVKMIDWKSFLCPNVKEFIEKVTLQTNKKQRSIVNQVPTDLLFYLNPEHSKQIIDEVVLQANHTFQKLKEKYTDLKVSLIGHSLGSVIVYDLLTIRSNNSMGINENININTTDRPSTMFNFPIENIFFIGSPLGMFLSLNKNPLILLDDAKYCNGFYNIFHPNDLVAYRIEPLINDFVEYPPYQIPYIKNDGLKKHKEKSSSKGFGIMAFCMSRNSENAQERNTISRREIKRYDYVLQEGYFENIIESLGIIGGHWAYWDSADLFYFILNKIQATMVL